MEYDISLCKAALLPTELSIERRVDVPKKFILPNYVANDVVDSTIDNTNNLKLFPDDVLIDHPEEDEIKKEVRKKMCFINLLKRILLIR